MPIGFSVRIMPGVRIRASSRGISAGLGPRIARVNVGTRGVGLSSGLGPFQASARLGSRGRGGRRSGASSLAAYQRELRRAQQEQEIAETAKLERELVSVHLEDFDAARPLQAPPPEPVDPHEVRRRMHERALRGISVLKRVEREAARFVADAEAMRQIRLEEGRRAASRAEEQARLDGEWRRLVGNDPPTVLAALDAAFEDNEAPAAPVNCEGDEVTVMVLFEPPDAIPDKKPAVTPSGKPTLRKRNKTERNDLYAASMASNVLATAKEAFAVAPGVNRAVVVAVRKDEVPGAPRPLLSCLYCGRFEREAFARTHWGGVDPLDEISRAPDALIERKGRTAEVAPLKLSGAPDLELVLRSAASMLSCDPNLGTGRGARGGS